MSFTRPCPQCGKELSYKYKDSLRRAIRNNNVCVSCVRKGRIFSKEHRRKLSIVRTGKTHTEEHKRNMSKAMKGRIFSKEHKRNISIAQKGNTNGKGNKGKTHSKESRIKMSIAHTGKKHGPHSEEARRKISLSNGGDGTLDKDKFNHGKLAQWSKAVRKRDNHTCQYCGATEKLESHHVFPKGRFPALAYDLNNGRTLCKDCHIEEHKLYATDYFKDLFQAFSDFA